MTNENDAPKKMQRVSRDQVETHERFYKIPKALFENELYSEMKLETKMAYAILRDRFLLSIKNNWIDNKGDVYLIYKNSDLQTILSVGEKKVISLKKELAAFGLLEEERQGLNKPNRLYVGNINADFEVIHRANPLGDKELSKRQVRNCQNDRSRNVKTTGQGLSKRQSNETESSEINLSDTKTDSFDEEDDYITESEKSKTDSESSQGLIAIGEIIQKNPKLRNVVQTLIPDLLVSDAIQANIVVNSLSDSLAFLKEEFSKGNTILQTQTTIHGEERLIKLLEENAKKQLVYMNENLIDNHQFGRYFAKGLAARLRTAITTDKYAMGY